MKKLDLQIDIDAVRKRIERDMEGYKASQWAQKLGVSRSVVSNIHGKKRKNSKKVERQDPSLEYIITVSRVTNKPIEYYLYGEAYREVAEETISPGRISEYAQKGECPFRNKELALRVKEDLAYIEANLPLEYLWLVEKIRGKVDIDKFFKKKRKDV